MKSLNLQSFLRLLYQYGLVHSGGPRELFLLGDSLGKYHLNFIAFFRRDDWNFDTQNYNWKTKLPLEDDILHHQKNSVETISM